MWKREKLRHKHQVMGCSQIFKYTFNQNNGYITYWRMINFYIFELIFNIWILIFGSLEQFSKGFYSLWKRWMNLDFLFSLYFWKMKLKKHFKFKTYFQKDVGMKVFWTETFFGYVISLWFSWALWVMIGRNVAEEYKKD